MTLVAIVLLVVGAGVSLFATSLVARPLGWSRTTGEVIGVSASAPSYAPHRNASFSYQTDDGTEHTVWTPEGTGTGPLVGQRIQVRFDPKNPSTARAAAALPRIFVLIAVGDALLVAGILLLVL